jgi:hypothetical protein
VGPGDIFQPGPTKVFTFFDAAFYNKGGLSLAHARQAQAFRQVDDGQHAAAQIDHALDVGRRMRKGVENIHPLISQMARILSANS